tara:strand:+ start:275 stop:772 length:498 start_codon:yes stop_codon:yes gene_type:complete
MPSVIKRVDTSFLNTPLESYPAKITKAEYREYVTKMDANLKTHKDKVPDNIVNSVNPVKHTFADGLYLREIFMPGGEIVVSKIHKVAHPFFLLKGKISVLTEEGEHLLKAPYYCITPVGTKRMLYTHTDSIVVTVHRTFETEIDKIEKEIIAKNFKEIEDENDKE